MYNSIYPININYRKPNPYQYQSANANSQKHDTDTSSHTPHKEMYPVSNQINISQILMDFRNTILAINAPEDVQEEINTYLNLVDKESKKESPSRDIIFSNLKNASRISDDFIASALGKKSNVVEGWIGAIFQQNINLKSNPDEINPDFLLKFPQKAQDKISGNIQNNPIQEEIKETPVSQELQEELPLDKNVSEEIKITEVKNPAQNEEIEVQSTIDTVSDEVNIFVNQPEEKPRSAFSPNNIDDEKAKVLYSQARKLSVNGSDNDYKDALNLLNEALGYLTDDSNSNIRAAIHFERAKIFDSYDYVDYALRDYYEATKALDLNLKANAYYKSGSIYDEFKEFDPALDNYLSSVAYSGEADNLSAQSMVLSKISSMYAKKYDSENAHDYADLAIDTAVDSKNSQAIASTYSTIAQNYQYLGDSKQALEHYKNALAEFSRTSESYEEMAYNYSQASIVMRELGNYAKADKLQQRANQYYQKAQLQQDSLELAS